MRDRARLFWLLKLVHRIVARAEMIEVTIYHTLIDDFLFDLLLCVTGCVVLKRRDLDLSQLIYMQTVILIFTFLFLKQNAQLVDLIGFSTTTGKGRSGRGAPRGERLENSLLFNAAVFLALTGVHQAILVILALLTVMEQLTQRQSSILKRNLRRFRPHSPLLVLQDFLVARAPSLPLQIIHVLLLAVLEDRPDGHRAGRGGTRRLLATTEGVTIALNLVLLLLDPQLGRLEGSLRHGSLVFESRHAIVAQVLVESIHHCIDGLLGASVAIGCLMVRLWARLGHLTLVAVGERTYCGEVLLSLIRVDLLTIKLWIL